MPIHRTIFRIDYPLNYRVIDSPGTILRILNEGREDYWDELREDRHNRKIVGAHKGVERSSFVVEPTNLNWSIETAEGWSLENLANGTATLDRMFEITQAMLTDFGVHTANRAGFRVYYLSNGPGTLDQVVRKFRKQYNEETLSAIESSLGDISDYALAFDGNSQDEIYYRLRAGPYLAQQAQSYFNELASSFQDNDKHTLVIDLDQYERSFELKPAFVKGWVRPIAARADKAINSIEKLVDRT